MLSIKNLINASWPLLPAVSDHDCGVCNITHFKTFLTELVQMFESAQKR